MVGNSTKAQSLKKLHYHYSNLAILMHRITLIWYLDIHNLTNKFSQIILAYFFFNFCSEIRFLLLWNDLSITSWLYKDSLDGQFRLLSPLFPSRLKVFAILLFLPTWPCSACSAICIVLLEMAWKLETGQ